jgi:hypothetical protein
MRKFLLLWRHLLEISKWRVPRNMGIMRLLGNLILAAVAVMGIWVMANLVVLARIVSKIAQTHINQKR